MKLQEPEMLPETPGRLYEKNKSIGNISESNLNNDISLIFWLSVTLNKSVFGVKAKVYNISLYQFGSSLFLDDNIESFSGKKSR